MAFRRVELPIQWAVESSHRRGWRVYRLAQIDRLLGDIENWNLAVCGCHPEPRAPDDLLARYRRLHAIIERECGTALSPCPRRCTGAQLHEIALDLQTCLMREANGPESTTRSAVVRELRLATAGSGTRPEA